MNRKMIRLAFTAWCGPGAQRAGIGPVVCRRLRSPSPRFPEHAGQGEVAKTRASTLQDLAAGNPPRDDRRIRVVRATCISPLYFDNGIALRKCIKTQLFHITKFGTPHERLAEAGPGGGLGIGGRDDLFLDRCFNLHDLIGILRRWRFLVRRSFPAISAVAISIADHSAAARVASSCRNHLAEARFVLARKVIDGPLDLAGSRRPAHVSAGTPGRFGRRRPRTARLQQSLGQGQRLPAHEWVVEHVESLGGDRRRVAMARHHSLLGEVEDLQRSRRQAP